MRKSASLLCLLSCAAAWCQSGAVVEIDAAKIQHPIPRTIYGTFLEPIGHSIYGGLWAQVLENPSFEGNLWSAGRIRQMLAIGRSCRRLRPGFAAAVAAARSGAGLAV